MQDIPVNLVGSYDPAAIGQYVAIVVAYSFILWGACQAAGNAFDPPWKRKIKVLMAFVLGPLGGIGLYGVGWLPVPADNFAGWILAAVTGLACTVGAEFINDQIWNRFKSKLGGGSNG